MKIRFLRNVLVEVSKARLQEVWDKQYLRWQELGVERISYYSGNRAEICTYEGDILIDTPVDAFEVIDQGQE